MSTEITTTRAMRRRSVLPGFGISIAITSLVMTALVIIPLSVLALRAASLGPTEFLAAAWTPRARAARASTLSSPPSLALAPWTSTSRSSGLRCC